MSSATDQIFINAAGNVIGGPAAGYAAVRLYKFTSSSYHRGRGKDYMSDMLKYMSDSKEYLSVVELEELTSMKKDASAAEAKSEDRVALSKFRRWRASREFHQYAKAGESKARSLSENAKHSYLQRLTEQRKVEAEAAVQQANISPPERAHIVSESVTRPPDSCIIAQRSNDDLQRSNSRPPSRTKRSVRFRDPEDPFRTPTASTVSLSSRLTATSGTVFDSDLFSSAVWTRP
ncbi:uncharacterized protein STEHIDRAFT_120156 [Stereum hirsutum FP-91666 SS1]|uniref:uncharacterized protein n=1 Tax=Stereum hirsutum (strain FP-91666) TaxID=721885 RepID=UPI000440DC8C|nr:uncharacterized protein STEHIDRAFT_120156 [Stereum hirsutum FP-91666 SS1]EIM87926.1 hypothetical protein STEHIDRAFT_120156 [Stereum hirsutum FP-91666 SS1]